jgi:chorismate dehydratase
VLLVSRVGIDEIRSVALDPESRTSNALTRVLFAEFWRRSPEFVTGAAGVPPSFDRADAAVRIGDKALFEPPPPGARVYDLGAVWSERTGLPFVFAAWIARRGVIDREIYRVLHDSRRRGSQVLGLIAEDYTWRGAQYPELALDYLTRNIRYRLGGPEVRGLRRFLELAAIHGVIERPPEIRFVFERWTACHDAAAAGTAVKKLAGEVRHG